MLSEAPGGAVEGELVDERLWAAIAALRERGVSRKAIARQLGLDIKTVRKWWGRSSWQAQQRRPRGRLLKGWEAFLRARACVFRSKATTRSDRRRPPIPGKATTCSSGKATTSALVGRNGGREARRGGRLPRRGGRHGA